jgi:hypothetical protein
MYLSPNLLKQMNANVVPNQIYYTPESDFKSLQPTLTKGELSVFVSKQLQITNINALDARSKLCSIIGENNKLDEQDYLTEKGKNKNENDNCFHYDDNYDDNDNDDNVPFEMETEQNQNLEQPFKSLQKYRAKLDFSIEEKSQHDSSMSSCDLVGFIVKCVETIDNAKAVLYSDVVTFITENKECLVEQIEWEFMFSLLFTQFFKYREAGLVIYRNGVFIGQYIKVTSLTDQEKQVSVKKLTNITKSCRATVNQIKEIILGVFESCQLQSVAYAILTKAQHELLTANQRMTELVSRFECETWMINLMKAASKCCKLELLVRCVFFCQ